MSKKIPYFIIVAGVILICIGLILQIPSKKLATHSIYEDYGYSVVEEYVGGDAYNYIIGASLVAGEIAGKMMQKAIFISVGLLITCIGFLGIHKQNIYAHYTKYMTVASEKANQFSEELPKI